MSLDVTAAAAVLKKTYPDGIVEIDYRKSKTLALLKKRKGGLVSTPFGESFDVPVKHGNPQAGSATYATGYNLASSEKSRYSKWVITPGTVFHFADVNGDITRRGASTGSFIDAMASEIEHAKDAIRRMAEIMLFKGGWGDLGRLSAAANVGSTTAVVLNNPWMVRYFEKGIRCVFSASEAGNTLKGATPAVVTGRHPSAGTLDFDIAPNTAGTAAANSDFIFRNGDRQDSAGPTRLCPTGFKGWLPQTAPTATLFNGLDRTSDDRLGGLRWDATQSGSIEEAFMDSDALVEGEGGEISHYVMGTDTFTKLAKSLTGKIEYCDIMTDVGIGLKGFTMTGSGAIFYKDPACEEGVAYGFNLEEFEILYAGKDFCSIINDDGLMFRRVAGSDLWRAELVACFNTSLPAPGQAVVVYNL